MGCLYHPSEATTETARFTYSRVPQYARWRGWVCCSRYPTGEGDRLCQLSFRRRPSFLDWIRRRAVRVGVSEGVSGRFLLRWPCRRSLPGRVLFPPLTVRQTGNHLVVDRLFLRWLRYILLWTHPPLRYRVLIAKIRSSGRIPRYQRRLIPPPTFFQSLTICPSPSSEIQKESVGNSCRRRVGAEQCRLA